MRLTSLLKSARAKYGGGRSTHLREMPDGRRQVIRFPGPEYTGVRDGTGVEVVAETTGPWAELGVRP